MDKNVIEENITENSKKALKRILIKKGYANSYIKSQISFLYERGGYISRINFLLPLINSKDKEYILISGSSVGTELLIAEENHFRKIIGTEIQDLYKIPSEILLSRSKSKMIIYDGLRLPFSDSTFTCIQS